MIVSVHKSQSLMETPRNVWRESLLRMTLGNGRNWSNIDSHLTIWINIHYAMSLKQHGWIPHIRKGWTSLSVAAGWLQAFEWKLRASFEWNLAKFTKSMALKRPYNNVWMRETEVSGFSENSNPTIKNTRVWEHAGNHEVHGSMYLATVKVGKVISFIRRPC